MRHVDRPVLFRAGAVVVLAVVAAACDTGDGRTLDDPVFGLPATTVPETSLPEAEVAGPDPAEPMPIRLFAPWPDGGPIPDRHTCVGDGISPALSWTDAPAGTVDLVLTLTDLDAGLTIHWLVDAVPPTVLGLVEGEIPEGAFERANDSGVAGYEAPCPPAGETHLFQFTVHALNQQLEVADDASAAEVIALVNGITIGQSSVSGTATGPG